MREKRMLTIHGCGPIYFFTPTSSPCCNGLTRVDYIAREDPRVSHFPINHCTCENHALPFTAFTYKVSNILFNFFFIANFFL